MKIKTPDQIITMIDKINKIKKRADNLWTDVDRLLDELDLLELLGDEKTADNLQWDLGVSRNSLDHLSYSLETVVDAIKSKES